MKCRLLHDCQEDTFTALGRAKKPSKGHYLLLQVDTEVLWVCKLARRANKRWSFVKHQVPGSIADWGNRFDLLWKNCPEHWKSKQLPGGMAGFPYKKEFALQYPNGSAESSSTLSAKLLPMRRMSTKMHFISCVKRTQLDFVLWCLHLAVLLMSVSVRIHELM